MTAIKFGVALPYVSPRAVADLAQQAETAGWDGCFLGDAIWCEDPMIGLAAAAMVTRHIRLGTLVTPVPLRRPWKLASESLALDHLSGGRLTLGLATGATWMGWQAFPDEKTDKKMRAEMLDETIDILTLLYACKPFDYDGQHYHVQLTALDEMYYPPRPVQQPRIPLWCVGVWPREKSMRRALKADGIIVEKLNDQDQAEKVTPADIQHIQAYVAENRPQKNPFDIVVVSDHTDINPEQPITNLPDWVAAGTTWWIMGLWAESAESARLHIQQGPPPIN
jgi:alkanesulfonate monooxygenase SsuD/methylene tetrahydromethanopterin reductase-like flavin-dependent oxidoreductase (luciferase family)